MLSLLVATKFSQQGSQFSRVCAFFLLVKENWMLFICEYCVVCIAGMSLISLLGNTNARLICTE